MDHRSITQISIHTYVPQDGDSKKINTDKEPFVINICPACEQVGSCVCLVLFKYVCDDVMYVYDDVTYVCLVLFKYAVGQHCRESVCCLLVLLQ